LGGVVLWNVLSFGFVSSSEPFRANFYIIFMNISYISIILLYYPIIYKSWPEISETVVIQTDGWQNNHRSGNRNCRYYQGFVSDDFWIGKIAAPYTTKAGGPLYPKTHTRNLHTLYVTFVNKYVDAATYRSIDRRNETNIFLDVSHF